MTTLDSFGLKFVPGITALVTIPAAVVLRSVLYEATISMHNFFHYKNSQIDTEKCIQ